MVVTLGGSRMEHKLKCLAGDIYSLLSFANTEIFGSCLSSDVHGRWQRDQVLEGQLTPAFYSRLAGRPIRLKLVDETRSSYCCNTCRNNGNLLSASRGGSRVDAFYECVVAVV